MVRILDTTLREGEQTPGVHFDVHTKMAIAALLDQIGVDFIEAGHPAIDPEIGDAVGRIARAGLVARVGAHARSLDEDIDSALACGAGFVGIFYCVSERRLADRAERFADAVTRIVRQVLRVKERSPWVVVRYTPEDAVRSDFEQVLIAAAEAVAAGADIISVADTTGWLVPGTSRSMYDFVARLRDGLASRGRVPMIAIHCHNDRGLALANALEGIRAGAEIVDASVLGLGERAGIVDLATLLTVLAADFQHTSRWRLDLLPELYQLVSRFAGIAVPPMFPVMGRHAFTHCAGVHTHAALRNPLHYQSLDPAIVGRVSRIALDHMSGISSVRHALAHAGRGDVDEATARAVLARVRAVGRRGRTVEEIELLQILDLVRGSVRTDAA